MKKEKTFHYTNPEMVKYLLSKTPYSGSVLDAGSGKNKVWFNELRSKKFEFAKMTDKECPHGNYVGWCDDCEDKNKIYECEIDDGCDFFKWDKKVDWVVGNPPYHESWLFTEQALKVANKGIAWLLNNQALNSHFTPARLSKMWELGFTYSKIIVVADKRWFGRYYFVILEKDCNNFIEWNRKTY